MRVRLPLYSKILLWFFLNLLLVAGLFALLFNAQFNFDLNWLLVSRARERVETMRNLILADLNSSAPENWPALMERFSEAYHVQLSLFDDDADHLVGEVTALPAEVRERILARPDRRRRSASPAPSPNWRGPPLPAFLRTSQPARYWLLLSGRLDNPQFGNPLRVVLVSEARSLSSGGIVFDPAPWLQLGGAAILVSMLFWLPLVGGMSRAIGRITNATQQIAEGRFDVRVNARRRDEIGSLGLAINQMASRLDGFVQGQKRFLGDIAHELCAPLAKMQMALGILEERADAGQKKYVQSAGEKARQISELVNELLLFSKASFGPSAIHLQPVNVRACVDEAVRRETTESADLRIEVAAVLHVTADPDLLVRALANLLRNAIRHAGGGPIFISAKAADETVAITVADSGPGVPDEQLAQIFDAFYRLDPSRSRDTGGVGLGLTIVKTCVESCGGTVTARNRQPRGLEIVIELTAAMAADLRAEAVPAQTPRP